MSNAQQAEQELDDDLNGELEIEIVEDVEEDDKPRVSEKDYTGPEIPEDDEIESYSERVQKRMKKLSFEAKEAERQRQALAREREELLRVSQTFHSENEKLRQQLQQNEGTLVAQAKARLEAQLAQAKASYKEAYELGDTEKMIEAQEKLTSLNNDMYRVNNYKPRPAQPAQQPAPQAVQQAERPQAPKLDERQEKWLSDNDWYGKDRQMTAFALGVHEELVYNGVDPNSDKYYTEINSAVRKRFADKFEDDLEEVEVAPKKKANVVAPATRSSKNPQKVKLTQTQVALAKRLGLTPQQYAAQLLKEQLNG